MKPAEIVKEAVWQEMASASASPTKFARHLINHNTELQALAESSIVRYVQHAISTFPKPPSPQDVRFVTQKVKEAEKWRKAYLTLEDGTEALRTGILDAYGTPMALPDPPQSEGPSGDYVLVPVPTDLHFGQPDRRRTFRDLMNSTELLISRALCLGRPDEIVLPIGSDWLHIDTDTNTTTAGTPQVVDIDEPGEVARGAMLTMRALVERYRQVAARKVTLIGMFGNHDLFFGKMLLAALEMLYRDTPDVDVLVSFDETQVYEPGCGNVFLGFHHGHGIKPQDLPAEMSSLGPRAWGRSPWRLAFSGHQHHKVRWDVKGCLVNQCPSLARSGRWSKRNGYTGSLRGQCAFAVHPEHGPFAEFQAFVNPYPDEPPAP